MVRQGQLNEQRSTTVATRTALLPRVSRSVQELVVARAPLRGRRVRRPTGELHGSLAAHSVRRVVVLTAASLALAGATTATALWLSRRFSLRACEDPRGQGPGVVAPLDVESHERAVNGATLPAMEAAGTSPL